MQRQITAQVLASGAKVHAKRSLLCGVAAAACGQKLTFPACFPHASPASDRKRSLHPVDNLKSPDGALSQE